jgi:hypothetical protein
MTGRDRLIADLEHDREKHVLAKAGMDTGFSEKSRENKRI